MPMTTAQIDALPTLTLAQELKLVDYAITQILSGAQSYNIGDRGAVKARYDMLVARKAELVDLIDAEAAAEGGGIALVQYGERV